jgi:hypothetical protein
MTTGTRASTRADNLLVRLYRLAHRQQENFVTEAFANVLIHLIGNEEDAASRVLEWLGGEGLLAGRPSSLPITVRTQAWTAEFGIPDLRIQADDLDVIVEVKLGSQITPEQIEAYIREIEAVGKERRAVVALVGYPPLVKLPEGTQIRTWGELGMTLSAEAEQSASGVTRHLVEQLIGLLYHLELMPLRVRSGVSEGLLRHRAWADLNPGRPAVTRTRLRSLRPIRAMEGCGPLHDLLHQMRHVLAHSPVVRSHRFDSGPNMARPWIGFNVNDMEFFFFVSLSNPERVVLQRFWNGVDPESFDGSMGELDLRSDGITRWRNAIDLADPDVGYFGEDGDMKQDPNRQLAILTRFFEESFQFGQILRGIDG